MRNDKSVRLLDNINSSAMIKFICLTPDFAKCILIDFHLVARLISCKRTHQHLPSPRVCSVVHVYIRQDNHFGHSLLPSLRYQRPHIFRCYTLLMVPHYLLSREKEKKNQCATKGIY